MDKIEFEDVDELFTTKRKLQKELKRKEKVRRKFKRKVVKSSIFVIICICLGLYFISDISKVKSLKVIGNDYLSDENVLKAADLSYESRYMLKPAFYLKFKLKRNDFIEDVKIDKTLSGSITIEVTEKKVIGYMDKGDKQLVLLQDNTFLEVDEMIKNSLIKFPYIHGFSEKQLTSLTNAFEKVDKKYISRISEMYPYETSYDKNMVQLIMQDGNKVLTSMGGIKLMVNYDYVLENLKGNHVCLYIDEVNKTMIKQECQ